MIIFPSVHYYLAREILNSCSFLIFFEDVLDHTDEQYVSLLITRAENISFDVSLSRLCLMRLIWESFVLQED